MAFALFTNAARAGLNAVLPPLCLACEGFTESAQALCAACWKELHFITPPFCGACGIPFEFEAVEGALCGECMQEPPHFTTARAALSYTDSSRALILPFKNKDRTDAAPALARFMAQAGGDLLRQSEVIVPVPLHPLRLFSRRYNQAAMLARLLGKSAGKKVRLQGLVRKKRTPSQGTLHRSERRRNVAGAFSVPSSEKKHLAGRRVLLIDDVLTTGATANACAAALLKAGAKEVRVLALARVKKGAI